MSLRSVLAFASLLGTTAFAQAPAGGILVALKLEQGGTKVASPRVLLQSAVPANVQIGEQLKVQVTAIDASKNADLRVNVYAEDGSGLTLVGAPRLLVEYGQESAVSWSSPGGVAYKLTVTPTLVSLPQQS